MCGQRLQLRGPSLRAPTGDIYEQDAVVVNDGIGTHPHYQFSAIPGLELAVVAPDNRHGRRGLGRWPGRRRCHRRVLDELGDVGVDQGVGVEVEHAGGRRWDERVKVEPGPCRGVRRKAGLGAAGHERDVWHGVDRGIVGEMAVMLLLLGVYGGSHRGGHDNMEADRSAPGVRVHGSHRAEERAAVGLVCGVDDMDGLRQRSSELSDGRPGVGGSKFISTRESVGRQAAGFAPQAGRHGHRVTLTVEVLESGAGGHAWEAWPTMAKGMAVCG